MSPAHSISGLLKCLLAIFASLAVSGGLLAQEREAAPPPPRDAADEASDGDYIVPKQGPVHEALVARVRHDPFVPRDCDFLGETPPKPITEVKPEIPAELAAAEWIGGYWDWSGKHDQFVWVSGIWRAPPPDHRWIPGKWVVNDSGAYRLSGYWIHKDLTTPVYVPRPPESLEKGPAGEKPEGAVFWNPGVWIYEELVYRWRPGHWAASPAEWSYVPAHYVWTPAGTVFIGGYWDYPVARRGELYAPVSFSKDVYQQADYRFTAPQTIPLYCVTESPAGYVYNLELEGEEEKIVVIEPGARVVPAAPAVIAQDGRVLVPADGKGRIAGEVSYGALRPKGITVKLAETGVPPVKTDEEGKFIFRDVEPGVYILTAKGPVQNVIREAVELRVTVESREVTEVQVELK